MTAFRLTRRTHEFSSTLFFVIVSAVPAEGPYTAGDILLLTGNAFSRNAAKDLEKRFEEQLLGEIHARGDSVNAA
jgi:hypothetical protein